MILPKCPSGLWGRCQRTKGNESIVTELVGLDKFIRWQNEQCRVVAYTLAPTTWLDGQWVDDHGFKMMDLGKDSWPGKWMEWRYCRRE